jgi:hypothetical protein
MPGNREVRNFNFSDVESIASVDREQNLYTNYSSNERKFIQNGCDDSNNKL